MGPSQISRRYLAYLSQIGTAIGEVPSGAVKDHFVNGPVRQVITRAAHTDTWVGSSSQPLNAPVAVTGLASLVHAPTAISSSKDLTQEVEQREQPAI